MDTVELQSRRLVSGMRPTGRLHLGHYHGVLKNWIKLQQRDKWFLIIPATVIQKADYSDIEGRYINYNWHMLDIHKKAFLEQQEKMNKLRNQRKYNTYLQR